MRDQRRLQEIFELNPDKRVEFGKGIARMFTRTKKLDEILEIQA